MQETKAFEEQLPEDLKNIEGYKLFLNPADPEIKKGYSGVAIYSKLKPNKEIKNKTILVEPRAFSEAQQIADYLKTNNQVVVNFKRVTSDVSKRIMDFLNGIIYAIEGTMQKLGPGIVICAPKGFEIEGKISEEESKKTSKKPLTTHF